MLSKNQIKFINSLRKKKHRHLSQMFVVEGIKAVEELIQSSLKIHQLYATPAYQNPLEVDCVITISEKELNQISEFQTPNQVLAIFHIPKTAPIQLSGLTLALDQINDPGNLGTIIRLCDWFDITQIICSNHTVDCYNSKVVQASMGSIARVPLIYTCLETFLKESELPKYGAVLNGNNVYQTNLPQDAILIMGNEANGISTEITSLITQPLTIPQFGSQPQTESLNVATATAILLSEFKRH